MARTAEVKIMMAADDPGLRELRRAVDAANRAAVGPRRRAFVAGWKLAGALSRFVISLKPMPEEQHG